MLGWLIQPDCEDHNTNGGRAHFTRLIECQLLPGLPEVPMRVIAVLSNFAPEHHPNKQDKYT
jgi:hypothetical protein